MSTQDLARGFVLGGVGYYLLYWWWPESGHIFGVFGIWRSAPTWIRWFFQRRGAEIHFLTVLNELWGAALIVTGAGFAVGLVRPVTVVVYGVLGAIAVPFIVSGAIATWRRRRSSGRPSAGSSGSAP